jgi:hypothetical protein
MEATMRIVNQGQFEMLCESNTRILKCQVFITAELEAAGYRG